MKCRECGTELPKEALFCYECGTGVQGKDRAAQPALIWTRKQLAFASVIAAVVLAALVCALFYYHAAAESRVEEIQVPEGQYTITLTGTFIVGEDEVLPPGIYNIGPASGRKEFNVEVTGENDYWDYLYRDKYRNGNVIGYKLKSGYRLDIGNDGAQFTKTADIETKHDPSSPSETPQETQPASQAGSPDSTQAETQPSAETEEQ